MNWYILVVTGYNHHISLDGVYAVMARTQIEAINKVDTSSDNPTVIFGPFEDRPKHDVLGVGISNVVVETVTE